MLEYAGIKLPFDCARMGLSFRNEISRSAGLLRVRKFQQLEIEYLDNVDDKQHPKFNPVRKIEINMYCLLQWMKPPYQVIRAIIGHDVSEGIIVNKNVGYFIGRTR